jgi:hypothetical protein
MDVALRSIFVMIKTLKMSLAMWCVAACGFSQEKPLVVVKHFKKMEYPTLARQARLQGSISIHLTISSVGKVVDAQASTDDKLLRDHPLLQSETVKLVRKWTFGCVNCAPKADYDDVLIFVFRLEGPETGPNSKTLFKTDSSNRFTITTNPPQALLD